jgi:hypothetical protein
MLSGLADDTAKNKKMTTLGLNEEEEFLCILLAISIS